jgi:hypothetical protein
MLEIHDRGEFYEIRNWTGGIAEVYEALSETRDKPLYFTIDLHNEQASTFYRRLFEMGKIEMTHIVCRKVK